jgi:hypothetical protein
MCEKFSKTSTGLASGEVNEAITVAIEWIFGTGHEDLEKLF